MTGFTKAMYMFTEGKVGVFKKITQNRKPAIDFDQNRKPHTKPLKSKIYTAQFSPNPGLDLKRR